MSESQRTLDEIERIGVVPILVMHNPASADGIAAALVSGGLPTVEVTLRTDAAEDIIRRISRRGDLLVGAGTVTTVAQVDRVVDAGAAYVVSPGLDLDIAERCQLRGIPIIPGIATATELQRAVGAGLTHVKLFPAMLLGGRAMIDALSQPFPAVRFMPSGGIGVADAASLLDSPAVFAVGGSWMCGRSLVENSDFDAIAALSAEARRIVDSVSTGTHRLDSERTER